MKNLQIPFNNNLQTSADMEAISSVLDTLPKNEINYQLWSKYDNNCEANFSIAHNGEAIFLKYNVAEDVIRIATYETNGVVHKDNCVEFFVCFGKEKKYYNIELNCVGIALMAYGEGRLSRTFINEELINKIKTHVEIKTSPINSATKYIWQITVVIPIEVFEYSQLKTLNKQNGFGNFFKCGDNLPQAHFFCWNKIDAVTPDFHLPEFFGTLNFG